MMNNWQKQPPEVFWKNLQTHLFSCEFCEISKNTFFTDHILVTTSLNDNVTIRKCIETEARMRF